MKTFFLRFFTWWTGATFGTLLWTALYGEFVGEDEFDNHYYRTRGGKIDPGLGFERRWVIYSGTAEASIVPPSWHGWLHHTVDTPPTEETVAPRPWWKAPTPNPPGPPRSAPADRLNPGTRPPAKGDRRLQGRDAGSLSPLSEVGQKGSKVKQAERAGAQEQNPSGPLAAVFSVLTGEASC